MRVLTCFEGSWESFDIPPDQTVRAIKQMVKDNFLVQFTNDNQYLELSYGGAVLQDSWALCDVGFKSGGAIHCLRKSEQKPVMSVFSAVTGEILPIMGSVSLLSMSVARLKTLVSVQSGLPVSTFRLSTPEGVQLYDCNRLQDYDISVGTMLRLDTWDGWVEYLQGCLLGHRLTVQIHLSEEMPVMRFQLRVALYIAASLGHLELAGWLLERTAHADEPVGVHPYRHWCHQTAHRDTGKCPIHAAAENNQLLILKLFVTKNILTLACRDLRGYDPLKIAVHHGHRDSVCYLVEKLHSVVSLSNITLPTRIYLQIKRWLSLGERRAASGGFQHTLRGKVGDTLLVDGFSQPKMSSKPRKTENKASRVKTLPPVSHLATKRTSLHLHSRKVVNFKETQEKFKNKVGGSLKELSEGVSSSGRSKIPLPPINRKLIPRQVFVGASPNSSHFLIASLEPFSDCCGRTPRENAMYFLTIASTFTEKPWLKQLSIARTLARKRIQTTA
ncbi:protein ANKUB1-like [Aulostomus maculatus]